MSFGFHKIWICPAWAPIKWQVLQVKELPWWFSGKESACQCRRHEFSPGLGRCPGEGNGNPLSMDRGVWQITVHQVAKSQIVLSNWSTTTTHTWCVCSVMWTHCYSVWCTHQAPLSMGLSQARILEWVSISSSRRSSWPRDQTQVFSISYIGRRIYFTPEPPGKPPTTGTEMNEWFCLHGAPSTDRDWEWAQGWFPSQAKYLLGIPFIQPWRRAWQPTPVFLPGESHGQRSLAGCSP